MAKYIACTIQFVDDQTEECVIIKDGEFDKDPYDESIFFYGYTEDELRNGCENGVVFEEEWKVISVDGVYENALP